MEGSLRRLAALLIALLAVQIASAQQAQVKHILLQQVTSGDSVVYLLGSVHIAKPDIYPLNDYIEEAFARSTRLVVEVDITKIDQASLQNTVLSLGTLPAGRTLRVDIGPEESAGLEKRLSELGMPIAGFDRFRPWVVYMVLAELDLAQLGYDAENGVDLHFLRQAGGREIVELETADYQLNLLAGFSDVEQRELLKEYLDESPMLGEQTAALLDAWTAGDAERFQAIVAEEMGAGSADRRMEEELLRKRDAAMAVKIESLLTRPGASFVVIGAAHFAGEGSVVDILKRDGYSVTTVPGR
jgi:uncharacterized protein YbaP (TraB family)